MKNGLSPESIQHVARGFSRARVLLTAVELDIFSHLADNALPAQDVIQLLGSDPRATVILLDALAAMDLLTKEGAAYRTAPALVPYLTNRSEETILPALLHSAHLWKTWSQLTDVVQKGGPAVKPATGGGEKMRAFIGAMHTRALRDAPEVVRQVKPGSAARLIDVGGGSGSYTIGFLQACHGMSATIFDRPEVVPMARERVALAGLSDRVTVTGGDYNTDELPGGHDLAFLSAIIHQNSSPQNAALYRNVHRALLPGGRIVVRDYVMDSGRTRPASGALFAVNMLVNTEGGNSYTFGEIRQGLESAGFKKVKLLVEDEMSSMVEGWKD